MKIAASFFKKKQNYTLGFEKYIVFSAKRKQQNKYISYWPWSSPTGFVSSL